MHAHHHDAWRRRLRTYTVEAVGGQQRTWWESGVASSTLLLSGLVTVAGLFLFGEGQRPTIMAGEVREPSCAAVHGVVLGSGRSKSKEAFSQ
jgi:hypothetical protein